MFVPNRSTIRAVTAQCEWIQEIEYNQGVVLRVRQCDSRRIVFLPLVLYRDVLRGPPSFNTGC